MQKTGTDPIEFVKAAPPDFRNPASCPALVLNADFPVKLLSPYHYGRGRIR